MDKCFSNRFFRTAASVMARWLAMVLLLMMPCAGRAQCGGQTTMGNDFWVMFLCNYNGYGTLSLVITSENSSTVHVSYPNSSFDTTVFIRGGRSVTLPVYDISCFSPFFVPAQGGIHVTSTAPISLYASNYLSDTYDIATILPTAALRTRYIAQTYGSGNCEVGFVATEDNTEITFTLPDNFTSSFASLSGTVTVNLMAGQTYQIIGGDMTGMEVYSNGKPFAMFQGNMCTTVLIPACDHLYEQSYPVDYWGTRFMLVSTAGRSSYDLVGVTSAEDSCDLMLDDSTFLARIDGGEMYTFNMLPNTARMLSTTKPVTVCVYFLGGGANNEMGDPASVIIPPIEQGVERSTFQAINTPITTTHYANIVTRSEDVEGLLYDGNPISYSFQHMPSGYACLRMPIGPGTHTISSSDGGRFLAWFYGFGIWESYAYIAASSMVDLTEKLFIDSLYTRMLTHTPQYCVGDSVHFHVESDEGSLPVTWFVDGESAAQGPMALTVAFDTAGDHRVCAVLRPCDTLAVTLHVNPTYDITTVDTLCSPASMEWHGHTFDADTFYTDSLHSTHLCDSVEHLSLSVLYSPAVPLTASADCGSGRYTLAVDSAFAEGCSFVWSSAPRDASLDGHGQEAIVEVEPQQWTLYSVVFDHYCIQGADTLLGPLLSPDTAWEINPDLLTLEHPWIDAYDRSRNVTERRWIVNGTPQGDTGAHLYYYAAFDDDSVEVMLVLNGSSCPDTLRRTIPFSHSVEWAPNAFTPGAESNNRFTVRLNEGVAEELVVYNRQGLLEARMEGPTFEWDGTRDGSPCPQGAYVWVLRYHSIDRPEYHKTITGTVTLIR